MLIKKLLLGPMAALSLISVFAFAGLATPAQAAHMQQADVRHAVVNPDAKIDPGCGWGDVEIVSNYNPKCIIGPAGWVTVNVSYGISIDDYARNWTGDVYYVQYNGVTSSCTFSPSHLDSYGRETLPLNTQVTGIQLGGNSYAPCV